MRSAKRGIGRGGWTGHRAFLVGAGIVAGAAAAARVRSAAERRRRLAGGEIRELSDMWTWVDGACWHVRFSAERHELAVCPIVLVHGFGISSSYFVTAAERLAPRFDVYAPDLPGHGRSDTPPEPLDVPAFAEALRRWLRVMRIEPVALVANSMGCQIAAELAARHPDAVERLVLIGPTMDRAARSARRVLPRFVAGGFHERASMTQLLVKDYAHMGPRLLDELRAMFSHRIEDALPRVAAPVMLVRGEHDRIAPQRWIDELAALAPGSRVLVVPRGGHAVHFGRPDAFVRAITPFLSEPARSGPLAASRGPRAGGAFQGEGARSRIVRAPRR